MYVYDGFSLTQIGLELVMSSATIGRWKKLAADKGDDWDKARSANIAGGDGIEPHMAKVLENFTIMANALTDKIMELDDDDVDKRLKQLASLADAMNKTVNAAGRIAPNLSQLGIAQDVIKRLLSFVKAEYPHHGAVVHEILEPFGEYLARAYE